MAGVRHLYLHLPFCAHRCGYCDFVTAVGREDRHASYVTALLSELEGARPLLAERLETMYLGGGTPTFLEHDALERLLAALPRADEVTVEANPETLTTRLAELLRRSGVTRVSLGAQSFQPGLLAVLERRATPDDVRRAFYTLRDARFDNISLDLVYGIPGESASGLARDLGELLELAPEHLSCYELEAKPGTRFAHTHGAELARQCEAMEGYLEVVVETLVAAGYRWYETASFCRNGRLALHNLAYWLGHEYVGIGIGAVSTVGGTRWRNRPGLDGYVCALEAGNEPPRDVETVDEGVRRRERLMLGLRLDEPLDLGEVDGAYDVDGVGRMERAGLLERRGAGVVLTARGRMLGDAVTVEMLAEASEIPANSPVPAS